LKTPFDVGIDTLKKHINDFIPKQRNIKNLTTHIENYFQLISDAISKKRKTKSAKRGIGVFKWLVYIWGLKINVWVHVYVNSV